MKLDFESVNVVIEAYDAWRGRKKNDGNTKLEADDGVEVLCASMIFLVALLQGCVLGVFEQHMRKRFPEIDDAKKLTRYLNLVGASGNGANPSEANINRLFARIGIIDVLDGFSWTDTSESDLRKLNDLSSIRNQIAHGTIQHDYSVGEASYRVNRHGVMAWATFVKNFAKAFEAHVEEKSHD